MKAIALLLLTLCIQTGCSQIVPPDAGMIPGDNDGVVSGEILTIQDATPVDGGVTLVIRTSTGTELTAFLPSFFRVPPPPQSDWELYAILRDLVVGDRIILSGPVTEAGIRILAVARQ